MNDEDNFNNISSYGCGADNSTAVPPAKPIRRIVITDSQCDAYIGCLVDITSKAKKPKQIFKQSDLYPLIKLIIKYGCKKSGGGIQHFEFNQEEFRLAHVRPDKSVYSRQVMTNAIKNITHHNMFTIAQECIIKTCATMYYLGQPIKDIIDPVILMKSEHNKALTKTKTHYTEMGFDIEAKKTCPCCHKHQYITNFKIWEDNVNLAIIELMPVCKTCDLLRQQDKLWPDNLIAFKAAWRNFHLMLNTMREPVVERLPAHPPSQQSLFEQLPKNEEDEIDRLIAASEK